MPAVSKAEFSRVLGVSKPRVSQYVTQGLPILSSGKIDLDTGIRWVAENIRQDPWHEGKGTDRAEQIVKRKTSVVKVKQEPSLNPPQSRRVELNALEDALAVVIKAAGPLASKLAVDAGATMCVAYAVEALLSEELRTVAVNLFAPAHRREINRGDWPFEDAVDHAAEDDRWAALAAKAGEEMDEDAWEEHLRKIEHPGSSS